MPSTKYIQGPAKGKANHIINTMGGLVLNRPTSLSDIPESMVLVVVVDNGPFEAAAVVQDKRDFDGFVIGAATDYRPRTYLAVRKEEVDKVT